MSTSLAGIRSASVPAVGTSPIASTLVAVFLISTSYVALVSAVASSSAVSTSPPIRELLEVVMPYPVALSLSKKRVRNSGLELTSKRLRLDLLGFEDSFEDEEEERYRFRLYLTCLRLEVLAREAINRCISSIRSIKYVYYADTRTNYREVDNTLSFLLLFSLRSFVASVLTLFLLDRE